MGSFYSKLTTHMVFATKYRCPKIDLEIEEKVYDFLEKQLQKMDCSVIAINGMPDHVHLLFKSRPDVPISKIAKQIKGASSFWINKNKLSPEKFSWQRGYAVFSVSDRHVGIVAGYIKNQKNHHANSDYSKAKYWANYYQSKKVG